MNLRLIILKRSGNAAVHSAHLRDTHFVLVHSAVSLLLPIPFPEPRGY